MTDAREIIAQVFRRAHRDACYPDASTGECEIAASAIAAALTAAGFRILSPDEVDQVTVEYEIWTVGDEPELCASTTDLADAYHYALVYGQDGLVEIVELTRRALGRKE